MPFNLTTKDIDRFWAKVEVTDTCWYWTSSTCRGYGLISIRNRHCRAARVAYELAYGPYPDELFVCHACDCPPCVRPDHLFLGTNTDNGADRRSKQRGKGVREDVAELVARYHRPKPTTEERFWSKVDKSGECWNWIAGKSDKGSGSFFDANHRIVSAYRFSYELANGPIPDKLFVCHTCDNRACVNPAHLFLGTQVDNMRDMKEKGRGRTNDKRGENNPSAKVTADTIREIRRIHAAGGITQRELARRYGMGYVNMSQILLKKTWKHID